MDFYKMIKETLPQFKLLNYLEIIISVTEYFEIVRKYQIDIIMFLT